MTQLEKMKKDRGFIAALDQSGGSTPKALAAYGIPKDAYSSDDEMFDIVHKMRTRIIKSPAFSADYILGAILFEKTMDNMIDGKLTGDYLWEEKGIIPFLKVDKGLTELQNGVQLMKPITNLEALLKHAIERNIFGTKMRSVIKEANPKGIEKIVDQQFAIGEHIYEAGLIPILEPEIDIFSVDKSESEKILKAEIIKHLELMATDRKLIFKLSIPTKPGFYNDLMSYPQVIRVAALSGGYSQDKANELLAQNPGLIASFSRALLEGLNVDLTDEEFNAMLEKSVKNVYEASIK